MALYRIHRKLDVGSEVLPAHSLASVNGELGDTTFVPGIRLKPKSVEALERKGAISRMGAPPLEVVAGWTKRAEKLSAISVTTVEDFVETPTAQLAAFLKVRDTTIEMWKNELLSWLVVSNRPPAIDAKCG